MTAREEFLSDVITTAIEGGIGYWSVTLQYQADGRAIVGEVRGPGTQATISPTDSEAVYVITPSTISVGLSQLRRGTAAVNRDLLGHALVAETNLDAGDIDADVADMIVQVALFGEVVYG